MVLGAVRAWLLAAAILPATWRGWDPHLPAVPGSHVHLRHDAQMFRLMLLVRAATRTEPVCQPRRQLHFAILGMSGWTQPRPRPVQQEVQQPHRSRPTCMDPNSGLDLRERPSMTYMPLDGKEKIYSSTGLR